MNSKQQITPPERYRSVVVKAVRSEKDSMNMPRAWDDEERVVSSNCMAPRA